MQVFLWIRWAMSKNVMLSQTLAAAALNAFRSNITGVSGGTTTLRLYQNPVDTDISFTLATPAYTDRKSVV